MSVLLPSSTEPAVVNRNVVTFIGNASTRENASRVCSLSPGRGLRRGVEAYREAVTCSPGSHSLWALPPGKRLDELRREIEGQSDYF